MSSKKAKFTQISQKNTLEDSHISTSSECLINTQNCILPKPSILPSPTMDQVAIKDIKQFDIDKYLYDTSNPM